MNNIAKNYKRNLKKNHDGTHPVKLTTIFYSENVIVFFVINVEKWLTLQVPTLYHALSRLKCNL